MKRLKLLGTLSAASCAIALVLAAGCVTAAGVTKADTDSFGNVAPVQPATVESGAAICAGLFYIMTTIAEPPAWNEEMARLGGEMRLLYAVHRKSRTGKSPSNGEVNAAVENGVLSFGHLYDSKSSNMEFVDGTFLACVSWYNDFVRHMDKNRTSMGDEAAVLSLHPMSFRNYGGEIKLEEGRVVRLAFKTWLDNGRPTPRTMQEELRKKLGTNPDK